MSAAAGYLITGGQFQGGKASPEHLFTGGVLVPDTSKAGIVYEKLKSDVFVKGTSISGIKTENMLENAYRDVFDISYEKGEHLKYTKMNDSMRERFDSNTWWSFAEVMKLKPREDNNNSHKGGAKRVSVEVVSGLANIQTKLGKDGPIIVLPTAEADMLKLGPNPSQEDTFQAMVKLTPNLILSNSKLVSQLDSNCQELAAMRRNLETSAENNYNLNTVTMNLKSELEASNKALSAQTQSNIDLRAQLNQKNNDEFDKIAGLVVKEAKDLCTCIKIVGNNVERLVHIQGGSLPKSLVPENRYHEGILSLKSPINFFMSTRSQNRLNLVDVNHEALLSPAGPVKVHPTPNGDLESFWCKIEETEFSGQEELAVFLLEIPKNQSDKPEKVRNHKTSGLVDILTMMCSTLDNKCKLPVVIATLPCQEGDLKYAQELETKLKNTDNIKFVGLNLILDRTSETGGMIVSNAGRCKGLSVLRTISEVS